MNRITLKTMLYSLFLLCALSCSQPAMATSFHEQAFTEGNELYAKEQYPAALEKYTTALNSGYESWEVFFNMGNAYYRSGHYPQAILYYEKAARLNPRQADLQHNLALSEQKIADRFDNLPEFFLTAWWHRIIGTFSTSGWAVVILIFFFLSLASLALYLLGNSYAQKKGGFYGLSVNILLLFIGICAGIGAYQQANREYAIIMQASVAAKISPEDRSETRFTLHEGSKVLIEDHIEPYYKIRIKNGARGWIPCTSVEMI